MSEVRVYQVGNQYYCACHNRPVTLMLRQTPYLDGCPGAGVESGEVENVVSLHFTQPTSTKAVIEALRKNGFGSVHAVIRGKQGPVADHCDECDAPQIVLPNGEHICGKNALEAYILGMQAQRELERG